MWIGDVSKDDFYRWRFSCRPPGLLEYESATALRTPLAGPAKFAAAFCCEAKCGVPAFGGWMQMSFALKRALNRPPHPIVRPRLLYFAFAREFGQVGLWGWLGSSMCSKLLRILPPKAGNFSSS